MPESSESAGIGFLSEFEKCGENDESTTARALEKIRYFQ
jgi:hypothetical protein